MGTRELPTAEVTFNGARAYQIGELEQGLSNVVSIVLTRSRLVVAIAGAAFMTRAAREASWYSEFRTAFGKTLADFPLVAGQIGSIKRSANRSTVAAFEIGQRYYRQPEERKEKLLLRLLIMLQKIAVSWDSTDVIRSAMSIFGGNGIVEDFTSLPRLFRDSAVNELWEGPRNVLLMQIYKDIRDASKWYQPDKIVKDLCPDMPGFHKKAVEELKEFLTELNFLNLDDRQVTLTARWDRYCHRLFHAFQDQELQRFQDKI